MVSRQFPGRPGNIAWLLRRPRLRLFRTMAASMPQPKKPRQAHPAGDLRAPAVGGGGGAWL